MSNKALETYQKILKNYNYFITIDPGARDKGGTGVAVFNTTFYLKPIPDSNKTYYPTPTETYQLESKAPTWLEKVDEIANQLYHISKGTRGTGRGQTLFFIERPKFFESFKGYTAASSDSLFKLCFVTGRLYGVIRSFNLDCILLPVNDWKGQLNKKQVSTRILRICGRNWVKDQEDAVGMGLYLKGLF